MADLATLKDVSIFTMNEKTSRTLIFDLSRGSIFAFPQSIHELLYARGFYEKNDEVKFLEKTGQYQSAVQYNDKRNFRTLGAVFCWLFTYIISILF